MAKPQDKAEEDGDCISKRACPPIRNVTHPLRYYEFTQDEIKALEECDRESFYRRCLPFSTALSVATYAAIRSGYLKKNAVLGAWPKVMLAALVGHVLGRLSNAAKCDKRLRELPDNSRLGSLMRKYHAQNNPQNNKNH